MAPGYINAIWIGERCGCTRGRSRRRCRAGAHNAGRPPGRADRVAGTDAILVIVPFDDHQVMEAGVVRRCASDLQPFAVRPVRITTATFDLELVLAPCIGVVNIDWSI